MENLQRQPRDISVIVPIFNEKDNIDKLYGQLRQVLHDTNKNYEIIFVDDGSTDGAFDLLRQLHQKDMNVKAIKFRKNFGQTAAMSAGFDYASGEAIVTMDGDLQNDPKDIPRLLEKIDEGFDIVSGWRVGRKDPFFSKRLPSYFANKLISWVTGVKLHDYGCTLKAYRREIIKKVNLYGEMHRFIPAIASWMGISEAEIKVRHHPRKHGKSKYGLSRTFNVILDLITVKFLLSFSTKPIQIFGFWGLLSLVLGGVTGLVVVLMKIMMKVDMTGNPLLYLTVLFLFVGIQFIMLGLLGEILVRVYHEAQNKPTYAIKEILD